MRHNKKFNHLGRKSSHRKAMLSNMCISLIMHKRIFTTVAKAKALKLVIEPLITKSKEDTTHSRRLVFQALKSGVVTPNPKKTDTVNGNAKNAVTELFQNISQKVGDRPGGYTRIIKTGNRLGDNASMCFIELVDYNENMLKEKATATKKRTRRSSAAKKEADVVEVAAEAPAKEKPAKKAAAPKAKKEEAPAVENDAPANEAPAQETEEPKAE